MSEHVETALGRFTADSRNFVRLCALSEPAQLRMAKAAMRRLKLKRFIDIGANLGTYSVNVGRLPFQPEVEAFEPSPDTFKELQRNLALNPEVRARLHNIALSDRSGTLPFERKMRFGPGNRIGEKGVPVTVARLDDVLSADGARDAAVKIDVEGHEGPLIEGARKFLAARAAYVQIETWRGPGRAPIRAEMKRLGFLFLLRAQGDQIFLHESLRPHAQGLRELHSDVTDLAVAVAARVAREGERALRDPALRRQARRLYDGFDDIRIGDAADGEARSFRSRLLAALGLGS